MTTPGAPTEAALPAEESAADVAAADVPAADVPAAHVAADELLIQFVRGEPDDEQVAAATVALLAVLRQKAAADDDQGPRNGRSSRPLRWTPDGYNPPGAWAYG
ncbi:acyl-CoA carboxylase epsilon subunit [Streptomyces sp. SPB162]|uniref:acyl-CoA carboxylase epsilon subunit n=1 Tax=Streptomyces sp. SPB162 TaxID=2940560 RepID=UPI002405C628|nr:acyl-CoA carboxylase epsilon subunit [Streptomyces sp. SPB162]MDF9815668.1 hypothetical protein [Streptomyces sp. SPB162]